MFSRWTQSGAYRSFSGGRSTSFIEGGVCWSRPDTGDRVVIENYADRWALITGASSGIGEAFAQILAALGMHLVLTARRRDLLEQLAKDLQTRHGTLCEIITTDLSIPEQVKSLIKEVESRNRPIELLVNNAGFGIVGEVQNTDVETVLEMNRLNIESLTELTYRFLPGMLERGQGAIINVSSVAAFQPVAYMPAYAAGKAYVLHFSEALWPEVRDRGVTVLALCPGTTRTPFFEKAGVGGWLRKRRSQSSEQVVKAALKAMENQKQYVVPGWRNYWRSLLIRIGSRRRVVTETMRYFRPPRKKKKTEDK